MSAAATASELVKAHIQVLDRSGTIEHVIPVLFNPTEYSVSKQISYGNQQIPGMSSSLTQFSSGDAETLSMELFFDTYEEGTDVRVFTEQLDELVEVDGDLHRPPLCRFVWGTLIFKAHVESIDKRFTMFRLGGIPVRARVDISFREYRPPAEQGKETPRSSPDRTTARRVTEGDTLPAIAAEEYGDPGKWRPIADANDIENPRDLQPGALLEVPPL
jgi:hypothetical protein